MNKYIIELDENAKEVVVISLEDGDMWTETMEVEDLEQLNSDYINEHFGDLQDEAYQRGLEDGKQTAVGAAELREKLEYQKGLNDAWEVARKIVRMSECDLLNIFTECYSAVCTALQVLLKYDASEAIEKLKAYEEKQKADDKIEVWDEVKHKEYKNRFVVTKTQYGYVYGISKDGSWNNFRNDGSIVKTGRHFDIASILEEMRND